MKKHYFVFTFLVIVAVLIPVFFTLSQAGILKRPPAVTVKSIESDSDPIRVVADFDFAPYSYIDSKGDVSGLDIEIVTEITNRLGRPVVFNFSDWMSCKRSIKNKTADLILGLEIFATSDGIIKTIPVSKDNLTVFGKNKINDAASLRGKKVGLSAGSIVKKIFDLNCEFIEYYTYTEIISAIENGEIDYGLCHASVAKYLISKSKYDIVPSITIMNSFPAIGVREDLPELRDDINKIITEISKEGIIKRLDEKWLSYYQKTALNFGDVFTKHIWFYAIYTISSLLVFSLWIFYFSMKKTREQHYQILSSMSEFYLSLDLINLKTDSMRKIKYNFSERIKSYYTENANDVIQQMVKKYINKEDVARCLQFTNLETVAERLSNNNGSKILASEFLSNTIGYVRYAFVPVNYDEDGSLVEVTFSSENINDERKEREHLLKISTVDELTGLYNRRAYEEKLAKLDDRKTAFAVFDVNELKRINDDFGHNAGDELIQGAAKCINEVYGKYGDAFRTGGDEFVVIITGSKLDKFDNDKLLVTFRSKLHSLKLSSVKEVAVSFGIAYSSEIKNFTKAKYKELINLADQRMYEDKALFYKTKGIDRRLQNDTYRDLCQNYSDIVRIDLKQNHYDVIKASDVSALQDYKNISEALQKNSTIQFDESTEHLIKRQLTKSYLEKYFAKNKKNLSYSCKRKLNKKSVSSAVEIMKSNNYSDDNQILYLYVK